MSTPLDGDELIGHCETAQPTRRVAYRARRYRTQCWDQQTGRAAVRVMTGGDRL